MESRSFSKFSKSGGGLLYVRELGEAGRQRIATGVRQVDIGQTGLLRVTGFLRATYGPLTLTVSSLD